MFGWFMWKSNVLVILYIFVVAGNYVDFCPRTILLLLLFNQVYCPYRALEL